MTILTKQFSLCSSKKLSSSRTIDFFMLLVARYFRSFISYNAAPSITINGNFHWISPKASIIEAGVRIVDTVKLAPSCSIRFNSILLKGDRTSFSFTSVSSTPETNKISFRFLRGIRNIFTITASIIPIIVSSTLFKVNKIGSASPICTTTILKNTTVEK